MPRSATRRRTAGDTRSEVERQIASLKFAANAAASGGPEAARAAFDEAVQRLKDLGAVRLGEPLVLDAFTVDDPEAAGIAWCREWLPQALAAMA